MSQKSSDEQLVSQHYHALKKTELIPEPDCQVEINIKQAAMNAVGHKPAVARANKYMWPLSIAASILLVSGVVLKLAIIDQGEGVNHSVIVDSKKPMYMLQRSRPASAEGMVLQLETFLNHGEIDKARQLHKKFRYYYPEYKLNAGTVDKLKSENII